MSAVPIADRRVRLTLLALGALLALVGAYYARQVLAPFALSLVIAYLLDPAVTGLEKRGMPRIWGVLLLLAFVLVAIAATLLVLIPEVIRQMQHFLERLPEYSETLQARFGPFWDSLWRSFPDQMKVVQEHAQGILPGFFEPLFKKMAGAFTSSLSILLQLVKILFVPVFTFYLLKDFPQIRRAVVSMVPPRSRPGFVTKFEEIDDVLRRWLKAQFIVSLILAAIYAVGMPLLGVPLGVFLGILGGLSNMVPYLGIVTGMLPGMILVLLDTGSWTRVLAVAALYFGAHLLEGTVITPRIVGGEVGMKPVMVLLAVLVGGEIFGLTGLLLAVPVTAAAMVFVRDARRSYRESGWFLGIPRRPPPRLPLRRRRPAV